MTRPMTPAPKPKPRVVKKARQPLRAKKPMRRVGKKGAAFPKVKNREFRRWLRENHHCEIRGWVLRMPLSSVDRATTDVLAAHICWAPIDPAHVGKKQSQGAPDLGHVIPLCRAAHRFYDLHRQEFYQATGLSEADLENRAAGYALKWVERGGAQYQAGATPTQENCPNG